MPLPESSTSNEDDEEFGPISSDYLVTETRVVRVQAPSAAEARKTAEKILQLAPHHKSVTTTIHTEKLRN